MASVHRAFRLPRQQQTERILRVLRNPHVNVLGHPTGRLLQRREAYDVDLEAILRSATANGVVLEIDGQPQRLDLDDVWSRRARDAGVLLACTSDATRSGSSTACGTPWQWPVAVGYSRPTC